jgi:spermidine synthase
MRVSDAIVFATGAAALVHEVTWARLLARLVGSDASATALTLATFLGGLALGAQLAAGLAARTTRPHAWFAGLELFVAAWAAMVPAAVAWCEPQGSFAARGAYALAFLVPPTIAMGATVPLLARALIVDKVEAGSETGAFYGANTLGAAVGALAGPFWLFPALGFSGTAWAAALAQCLAALAALFLLKSRRESDPTREAWDERVRAPLVQPLCIATFLGGAASLGLEVLAARLLVAIAGASVYSFALVLFVFLVGIALGARLLAGRRARTALAARNLVRDEEHAHKALLMALLAAPLLALGGLLALRLTLGVDDLYAGLVNQSVAAQDVQGAWLRHLSWASLALLPPALAFGAAFPATAHEFLRAHPGLEPARGLARLYAWNGAGCVAGALLAGFVLLPSFGPRVATGTLLLAPLLAALLVAPRRGKWIAAAGLLAALVSTQTLAPGDARNEPRALQVGHDAHTSVRVSEGHATDGTLIRSIWVNGKPEASTAPVDLRLQWLLGHIPLLLHGEVRTAACVGLGTGMTAGSLLDGPLVEELVVYEISPAVAQAARRFDAWNGGVLVAPRTKLVIADGRHALASTTRTFDLITADPVHPWTRGSSDLYTLEHFARLKARLAPGGVASQWLPLYELSFDDVRTVAATWCATFEHVSAWLTAYDLVLVGSSTPLKSLEELCAEALPERVAGVLAQVGVHSGVDVAALCCADDAGLRELARGTAPMRDDLPVIEFRAPRSALSGYCTEALWWAVRVESLAIIPPEAQMEAQRNARLVEKFLSDLPYGFSLAVDAYGRGLLGGQ